MKRKNIIVVLAFLVIAALMATIGSGAFAVFKSDPRVSKMQIVNDAAGFVGIQSLTKYAKENSDGTFFLDFTDTNGGFLAHGFNPKAFTRFDNVFRVQNRGTRTVNVWFESPDWSHIQSNNLRYLVNGTQGGEVIGDGVLLNYNAFNFVNGVGKDAYVKLDAGEYFDVQVEYDTLNQQYNSGNGVDMSHKIVVKADVTAPTVVTDNK